ncbi:transmembrane protein 53-like [Mercenaria mercenaria]|uniref:transmembrane protein 53-like n=1 Tax=Mercenaria mercenaria TaxID=6596 RepID=UPI00234F874E|nr:transmembrane protein 53-like [Mercenaria mercenaria]
MMRTWLYLRPVQKNLSSLGFVRLLSSLPKISAKDVNKNVRIFQHVTPSSSPRPLVLLFGWLFAKPKHLKKFVDMYNQQGFDVISVQVFLRQLLKPKRVQSLMRDVIDLCDQEERKYQQMLVHSLSVGGYMYGEVLTNFEKYPDKYGDVSRRLRGQIFDSVIDFYGIPGGIARAITHNKSIGNKIDTTLEWYLKKFPSITSDYVKASEAFHDNKLQLPSIFLYSVSDPVCNPEHYEELAAEWRNAGLYATSRFWDDTPHVSTFKKHNKEYTQTVVDFIRHTGVTDASNIKVRTEPPIDEMELLAKGKIVSP